MKQFMVTLQSEVAGDTQKEQFVINAKNLNEALEQVAARATQEYDLTGWEDMAINIKENNE